MKIAISIFIVGIALVVSIPLTIVIIAWQTAKENCIDIKNILIGFQNRK